MKKVIFAVTALLALFVLTATVVAEVPEPTEYFYVNDFAGVLSDETAQHIIDVNDDLYARTGAQVVVTTVEFTDGSDMEKYSYEMFNKWGIGGKGNGMLLLLSTGDQKYWVQRGSDLDVKFSAGEIGQILNDSFEDYFDDGEYDAAVMGTFDAFVSVLNRLYADSSMPATFVPGGGMQPANYQDSYMETGFTTTVEGVWGVFGSLFFFVVIIIIGAMLFNAIFGRGRRYYGGVGYPRRGFFWGWGRYGHHHHHMPPHGHNPGGMGGPMGGPGPGGMGGQQHRPNSAPRTGGGGFTFGGGIGRSPGGFGGSRPGGMGGFGGGGRSGGGGFTRGGGVGRK